MVLINRHNNTIQNVPLYDISNSLQGIALPPEAIWEFFKEAFLVFAFSAWAQSKCPCKWQIWGINFTTPVTKEPPTHRRCILYHLWIEVIPMPVYLWNNWNAQMGHIFHTSAKPPTHTLYVISSSSLEAISSGCSECIHEQDSNSH